ncbi:MAG: gamma-glutamyltranspeptidase [Actinobacteria bacterium]|nr:gamma-glutamyltranspeptidase [Actinomycetota bacterium]
MSQPLQVPHLTTHAPAGMVCSIDHLASSAGVDMLRANGSAVDAAIATSAVLAVTSQHLCGMGGDLWALVHHGANSPPDTLNASGRAGSGADADRARAEGLNELPMQDDIRATPVPGCVDGWLALHQRHGKLPFGAILAPAIELAENGFPASPILVNSVERIRHYPWAADYTEPGPLRPGSRIRRPGVARTLKAIASDGREGFYQGEFGRGLITLGQGEFTEEDLLASQADWVDPVTLDAFGHTLWTTPPNSQGYLSLASAWIADRLDLPTDTTDPLWAHLLVEASRQAGFDRPDVLDDRANGMALVAPERLAPRLAAISPDHTSGLASPGQSGDTMYMCAVDRNRMGVSLIQSNAGGWGSGLAEPSTRIFVHNRGLGFNLRKGHGAEYGPLRRPPHTLAPALVTNPDGSLRTVLGTMGGDTQPQIVLQLLARLLHSNESPGRAIASGRWRLRSKNPSGFHTWSAPDELIVEVEGHAPDWHTGLADRGHVTQNQPAHDSGFGHAHLIDVTADGLAGSADPRALTGSAAGH